MLGYTSFSLGGIVTALDHILQPSQGQMTGSPTESWISTDLRKENPLHLEISFRVQLMLVLMLVGTPPPRLLVLIPHAAWETQPSFDILETFPGGLWLGPQSLPLFLMVHGMISNRDQLYGFRHKALPFFCSTAKCRSYSKWKRRVFLKDTQVVCWFLHSGHFFLEPSYVINCSRSWLRLESAWFTKGSEWITDQRMGLL